MAQGAVDNAQLLLAIEASTEILRRELARGERGVDDFRRDVDKNLNDVEKRFYKAGESIGKALKGAIAFGAASLLGGSLLQAGQMALDYASSIGETAQQLGVGTDFLQRFRYAATQSGADVEQADKAIGKFNINIGKAREGNKAAVDSFAKLGVTGRDLATLDLEGLFRKVADGAAAVSDKSRLGADAVALFGKGGQAIIPVLEGGAAGFTAFGDAARKAGLVLSDETIGKLDALADKGAEIQKVISLQLAAAIGANADSILRLGDAAAQSVTQLFRFLRGMEEIRKRRGNLIGGLQILGSSADEISAFGDPAQRLKIDEKAYQDAQARLDAAQAGAAKDRTGKTSRKGQLSIDEARAARDQALALYQQTARANIAPRATPGGPPATGEFKVDAVDGAAKAAEAAAAKARREAEAAAARLQGLRDATAAIEVQIAGAAINLAAAPEQRLALQIAAAEEATRAAVAKVAAEGRNDTNAAQAKARTGEIEALKAKGAQDVAIIRENYAQANAEALAGLEAGNAQIEEGNARASIDLIRDGRDRVTAQAALAKAAVDIQIAEIEREIATSDKLTTEQVAALRRRQGLLEGSKAGIDADAARQREGPLQRYINELPQTANQINDALENVAVNGLQNLSDGIADAILNARSLGDVFSNVAKSILADLVKIAIQKAIIGPIANALFGGFGGGFADGGVPPAGKVSLVGERGPELLIGNGRALVQPIPRAQSLQAGPASSRQAPSGPIYVDARGGTDQAVIEAAARRGAYLGQQQAYADFAQATRQPIPRAKGI